MREAWSNRNGGKKVPDSINAGHLWLLPSDIHLSGAEIELSHKIGRETRLQEALLPIADEFDYINMTMRGEYGRIDEGFTKSEYILSTKKQKEGFMKFFENNSSRRKR